MSEKEVREAAKKLLSEKMTIWSSVWTQGSPNDQLKQALSEPPDVVVLLRWIDGKQKALPMNTPIDVAWYGALKVMRHYIEQKFHVRLTADGWEWVEPEDIWYNTDSDDLAELPVEDGE